MTPSDSVPPTIATAVDPVLRGAIAAGTAKVAPFPVPGLPNGVAWRVVDDTLDHPQQAYVGVWPDGTARVLNDDQPAFLDLARSAGATITDEATALGYVRAFLELTRGPTVLVRPVDDVGAIRWRPGTPDEEARRAAFLADPEAAAPTAEATPDGFHVRMLVIVDQRIQRNVFDVTRDGAITSAFRVVATDLPLPIAL